MLFFISGPDYYASRSFLQGWHTVTIPLEQVELAPENRQMDMQRIQGVGIFAV